MQRSTSSFLVLICWSESIFLFFCPFNKLLIILLHTSYFLFPRINEVLNSLFINWVLLYFFNSWNTCFSFILIKESQRRWIPSIWWHFFLNTFPLLNIDCQTYNLSILMISLCIFLRNKGPWWGLSYSIFIFIFLILIFFRIIIIWECVSKHHFISFIDFILFYFYLILIYK